MTRSTRRSPTGPAGAGPGRRPRRALGGRPVEPAPGSETAEQTAATGPIEPDQRRGGLVKRLLVLGALIAMLAFMYIGSVRVYFSQEEQLEQLRAEIAAHNSRIEELTQESERWQDPDFVRAQARSRLGWVVPGETGYGVIGPDGELIGPGDELLTGEAREAARTWWERLWVSVRLADDPAGATDMDTLVMPAPTPGG